MSNTEALIELHKASELLALGEAAANPDNWRPVQAKTEPSPWQVKNAAVAEQIDLAIMDLLDLAPERFSWQMLDLCETIITAKTETVEHVEAMAEIMQLTPPFLHKEATDALMRLMINAGRKVVSFAKPGCVERSEAYKAGWISV